MFKNKKYAWVQAGINNCNGTGCLISYYLIADFQYHRLHIFETYAAPSYHYFGDIDGNDALDFLLPCNIWSPQCYFPYCHTQMIALTPYHLNSKGFFEQKKQGNQDCLLIGEYYNGLEPRNFKITGILNWADWDRFRLEK